MRDRDTRGCSSVGRAPALQAGGHGFESHHLQSGSPDRRKKSEQINSRKPEKAILVKITRGLRLKANDKGFWKEPEKNLLAKRFSRTVLPYGLIAQQVRARA